MLQHAKGEVVEELGELLVEAGMQDVLPLAKARVPVVKFVVGENAIKVRIKATPITRGLASERHAGGTHEIQAPGTAVPRTESGILLASSACTGSPICHDPRHLMWDG